MDSDLQGFRVSASHRNGLLHLLHFVTTVTFAYIVRLRGFHGVSQALMLGLMPLARLIASLGGGPKPLLVLCEACTTRGKDVTLCNTD